MQALGLFTLVSRYVRQAARQLKGPSPGSLDESLVPRLFVRRLEDRCVFNGQGMPLAGTQVLVVIADSPTNSGPRDTVLLSRQGDQVQAFVDGTEAATANFNDLRSIIIVGFSKPDTFIIDFAGGSPIPYGGIQTFGGGNPAIADNSLVLQSAPGAPSIDSLVNRATGSRTGSMQLQVAGSAGTIGYFSVDRVEDTVATQSALLNDALPGDTLSINSATGGDVVTVASAKSPKIGFSSAPGSLTVDTSGRLAGPADAISIESIQSHTPLNLAVHSAATDTISISGVSNLGGGSLTVSAGTIQIGGSFTSGSQTYNGAVELQADTTLASTSAGAIAFDATVDGNHVLQADTAGIVAFNGVVGNTAPLTDLRIDTLQADGLVQFNMFVPGGASAGVVADELTVGGAALFNVGNSTENAPSVWTLGSQTYSGPVRLQADTVLLSSGDGNITFDRTVDSAANPSALAIDAAGKIYFGDNVGLSAPLTSVVALAKQGVTTPAGLTINTLTGVVSSAPPLLFVYQTTPYQEQIYPSQLTQTVYGYIGFAGAPSGYNELGQNYNIEVLWADGSVTTSDSQSSPIARPSPGYGSYVGYGTVDTMTSAAGTQGAWSYHDAPAVLPGFFPPAASGNGITFAVSHTYDMSFVANHEGGHLTAIVKLVNNSSIQLSDPARDGNIASGSPPAASSLNAVQGSATVPVAGAFVGPPTPSAFVPPVAVEPRETPAAVAIASSPPRQAANAPADFILRQDALVAERRMIEIVKLDPDGNPEKEIILTDVPEKLNELLEKLKQGAYRNGRYAVYLTEYSVAGHAAIGRRLLLEVYKSGHTLGDPVHEPGPGSNPIPQESPRQGPPAAPHVPAPGQVGGVRHSRLSPREGSATFAERKATVATRYVALAGCSLAAAAVVAQGRRGRPSAEDAWASRVDRALGENQAARLRRMARLARSRRSGKGNLPDVP